MPSDKGHIFFFTQHKERPKDILEDLKKELSDNEIPLKEDNEMISKHKKSFIKNDFYYDIVKEYLDVLDCLRENCGSLSSIINSLKDSDDYERSFINNVFIPLDGIYQVLLDQQTDLVGIVEQFSQKCQNKEITQQFDYLLVDEYQDMTNLRYKMIKALRKVCPALKVFAVGDDWQSIYSFSECKLTLFTDFKHKWDDSSGNNAKCTFMVQTRRFNYPLVDISNYFINRSNDIVKKRVEPFMKHPKEENKTKVFIRGEDDFKSECQFIATKINDLNLVSEDYVVLVRNNGDKAIQSILDNHSIRVETIHSMKGNQAKYVFVLNCNNGNMPYEYDGPENVLVNRIRRLSPNHILNEERRLFYVALTRAQKCVFLLYKNKQKSAFVNEIEDIIKKHHLC